MYMIHDALISCASTRAPSGTVTLTPHQSNIADSSYRQRDRKAVRVLSERWIANTHSAWVSARLS